MEDSLNSSSDVLPTEVNKRRGNYVGNKKLTDVVGESNPNSEYILRISADYVKKIDDKAMIGGYRHPLQKTRPYT